MKKQHIEGFWLWLLSTTGIVFGWLGIKGFNVLATFNGWEAVKVFFISLLSLIASAALIAWGARSFAPEIKDE